MKLEGSRPEKYEFFGLTVERPGPEVVAGVLEPFLHKISPTRITETGRECCSILAHRRRGAERREGLSMMTFEISEFSSYVSPLMHNCILILSTLSTSDNF